MNTKKLLSISVIAISLLVFAGCKTKTVTAPSTTTTTTTTTTTPTTPTTPVANGKTVSATQAQCLDLIAYGMKIAIDQGQAKTTDADALAKKASDLEMKYRAGNVEYEQACNKFMTDTTFINAVQKRIQEL